MRAGKATFSTVLLPGACFVTSGHRNFLENEHVRQAAECVRRAAVLRLGLAWQTGDLVRAVPRLGSPPRSALGWLRRPCASCPGPDAFLRSLNPGRGSSQLPRHLELLSTHVQSQSLLVPTAALTYKGPWEVCGRGAASKGPLRLSSFLRHPFDLEGANCVRRTSGSCITILRRLLDLVYETAKWRSRCGAIQNPTVLTALLMKV